MGWVRKLLFNHHRTLGVTIGRNPRGKGPEREGQERDALGVLLIPASCGAGGRRERLHRTASSITTGGAKRVKGYSIVPPTK